VDVAPRPVDLVQLHPRSSVHWESQTRWRTNLEVGLIEETLEVSLSTFLGDEEAEHRHIPTSHPHQYLSHPISREYSHQTISPSSGTSVAHQRLRPGKRLVRLLVVDVLERLLVLLLREGRGGAGCDDRIEDEKLVRGRHARSERFENLSIDGVSLSLAT
jgi:hypothetical protein